MGCGESLDSAYDLKYGLHSPELKRALMQKRFKDAGLIVQGGSVGNVGFNKEMRDQVVEVDPEDNSCALHWAAAVYGAFDVLSWLIEEQRGFDFDINAQNMVGDTALHIAIRKNDSDAVTIIMRQEKNFSTQLPWNLDGHTPLHLAMALNRHELLVHLVSEDGKWDKFNPDTILDKWGRPAIFAGIEMDSLESVKILVGSFKADSNIASRPNGNVADDDDTTTIPFVTSHRNSLTTQKSLTSGGGDRAQSPGSRYSSKSGGWCDESSEPNSNRDPRLLYAQLPTKKSMKLQRQTTPTYSPGGEEYMPTRPESLGSPNEYPSHTPPSSFDGRRSRNNSISTNSTRKPSSWTEEDGEDEPTLGLLNLPKHLSDVHRDERIPVTYLHKPNHGTQGLEWQTPLEYAQLVGAKRCIRYLEELKAAKYQTRRSTAQTGGVQNAIMKVTSTGGLAPSESTAYLPAPTTFKVSPRTRRASSAAQRGHVTPPPPPAAEVVDESTTVELFDADVSSI